VSTHPSRLSTDTDFKSPFLAYVSSTAEFDQQLSQYVSQGYVMEKYQILFGCKNVNLSNTTSYYARYTTSFICNGVVQNSRLPCGLSGSDAMPLCAESCASLAQSEEQITTDSQLCSDPNSDYVDQLRADFTNCALPANSLSGSCITGAENEPDNCGFSTNLQGLCSYCRASTENATDSCCVTSNATGRCQGVTLPVFSTIPNLLSTTSSSAPSATSSSSPSSLTASNKGKGLSGGAIAGIVVGSILGFLLLLALLIFGCMFMRRRKRDSASLNTPSPQRKGVAPMSYNQSGSQQGYEVLPGGRVARMSALNTVESAGPEEGDGQRGYDSDPYGDSPGSGRKVLGALGAAGVVGAVAAGKRDASLSSNSPGGDDSSPHSGSGGNFSSPEGVASGQSEQLPFFKDYYSSDDIHPNDKVAVLWAYQPRAGDEFELERGDMLKVVGIWDDGWATGVRIRDRAEDYDGKHKAQRDSGVSNGSGTRVNSPAPMGEIKAFPLVCVCLPEAWKKTVEGDTSTDSGSGRQAPT
jgi:hypothetical protein